MGIDLTLLPIDCENDTGTWGYSHTVLSCERAGKLWGELYMLEKRDGQPVPESFTTYLSRDDKYEEPHYGQTTKDAYGEPVRALPAKALMRYANHLGVKDQARNRAVWSYLKALPPETKVALYWS